MPSIANGEPLTAPAIANLLCVEALAEVPVVCAALGPVAGFPAARLAASHFSIMTRDTAQVLTGGPALVERALGEKDSKEDLGGAQVHERSGVVNNVAIDEAEVWRQVRRFLSYLPESQSQQPEHSSPSQATRSCTVPLVHHLHVFQDWPA